MINVVRQLLIFFLFIFSVNLLGAEGRTPLSLWYTQPARNWMTSALPIGNGELGGMFFGGIKEEHFQFNEKTLWTGSETKRGAYQNFGDVYLTFPHQEDVSDYRRELSLDNAIGKVSYRYGGVKYVWEFMASYPDKVIAMNITASGQKGKVSFKVRLKDAHQGQFSIVNGHTIIISGKLDLLSYEAQLLLKTQGGHVQTDGKTITVSHTDAATLLLTGGTNYAIDAPDYIGCTVEELHTRLTDRIRKAAAKSYTALKVAHIKDYTALFYRVNLELNAPVPSVPTDELIRHHKTNNYLDMLYFQYGRYLMIASSRGVSLPSNLQGIWNDSNNPAWQCDIHTNINVQMNYWPVENTNLSECAYPFLDYVKAEALKAGGSFQKVARKEHLRGWAVHTQTNIFGYTDWNINRPANAWYCTHLWNHYLYTQDKNYLKKDAFPIMKSTCEYWFDRLKTDSVTGRLIAPQEWSPEHGPWEDGVAYAQQLVWELFDNTLQAAAVLCPNSDFARELQEKFKKLDNGVAIGDWGQIKEWKLNSDIKGDDHRHLSQLIALYPGNQLAKKQDTRLMKAAETTLLSRGDNGTGWSRAWKISCWARLFDGNHAYKLLKQAQRLTYVTTVVMADSAGGVYENLLDAHPSYQIDGNFGATAGIAEMLLQSNRGYIDLLPALPDAWKDGSYTGLKTIGDFVVCTTWSNKQIKEAVITSNSGNDCLIKLIEGTSLKVKDARGKIVTYKLKDNIAEFPTRRGAVYHLLFTPVAGGKTL